MRIDADELADDGVTQTHDFHPHREFGGGLHIGLAGHAAQCLGQRVGGALDAGKDVGEAALGVEAVARQRQRVHRRQRGQEAAHAAGHDERDRQRLAPHQAQVAQQLAVQGFHHQLSSAGEILCALRSMRWIQPSPR